MLKNFAVVSAGGMGLSALAHHGWSSFDQGGPIYLERTVVKSVRRNPHAELEIDLPAGLEVPADHAQRALPVQTAPMHGKARLVKALVPNRKDLRWAIELAPLGRLQA